MLPGGKWARRFSILAGSLLMPFQKTRVQKLKCLGLPEHPNRLDWWLIAALVTWHRRQNRLDELLGLHRWLWGGEGALAFHEMAEARFNHWWQDYHREILQPLSRAMNKLRLETLCEIGCGSGLVLEDLSRTLPKGISFVGLDLSAPQIEKNRVRFAAHPQIRFEQGDATEWITKHARPHCLFFTNAGVFEYFPSEDLRCLLVDCRTRLAPCAFAIVEPLYEGFDVDRETKSRVCGGENSLSHPYPRYFQEAGYRIVFRKEVEFDGYRWLMLVAEGEKLSPGV